MTILGVQFDKMRVTPAYDAVSYESIFGTDAGKIWGGVERFSGLNVTIPISGYIIHGRHIRIISDEVVTVPTNSSGSIVITVDLTKSNDSNGNPVYDNYSVTNNQVYARAIATSNIRHEDTNFGGKVYDLEICQYVSNATKITSLTHANARIMNTPTPWQYRAMNINNDRTYAKQAMFDVTVVNKYRQFNMMLKRQGRRVTAQVNMKTVTTLAWEQLAELSNYPGYRPDGGDYSGMLNEMSYNTEPGGLYIANTSLRMMHIGRTDVKECNYSGAITYFTNDDFPNDADTTMGWRKL